MKNKANEKELSGESSTAIVEQSSQIVNMNPETLIAQAIEKGVAVETMEKLLAMRRELKAEWSKEQFDKALANFQANCPTIVKTKEVKIKSGIVAYKYAPIESIVEQVKHVLQENGFSYSTNMELLDNGVKVSLKITHTAGHSETTEMHVPLGNKTEIMSQTQVVAAAQTFAKRYAFCNGFGILTGDEDTDSKIEIDPIPPLVTVPEPPVTPRLIAQGFIDRLLKAVTADEYTVISEQVKACKGKGMITKQEFLLILEQAKVCAEKIKTIQSI